MLFGGFQRSSLHPEVSFRLGEEAGDHPRSRSLEMVQASRRPVPDVLQARCRHSNTSQTSWRRQQTASSCSKPKPAMTCRISIGQARCRCAVVPPRDESCGESRWQAVEIPPSADAIGKYAWRVWPIDSALINANTQPRWTSIAKRAGQRPALFILPPFPHVIMSFLTA